MSDRITLDDVNPDHFDKLVELLAEWISIDVVKLRITPPSSTSLNFETDEISDQIERQKLSAECLSQLRNDIPVMISGILAGHRNLVTSFLAEHSAPPEESEYTPEQLRGEIAQRIQLVEETVVSAEVRRQFALKSTAKNAVFLGTTWEINERKSEDTGAPLSDLYSATLRLESHKPPSSFDASVPSFLPFAFNFDKPRLEVLTLTLTLEDLNDLSDSIADIKKAFMKVSSNDTG